MRTKRKRSGKHCTDSHTWYEVISLHIYEREIALYNTAVGVIGLHKLEVKAKGAKPIIKTGDFLDMRREFVEHITQKAA